MCFRGPSTDAHGFTPCDMCSTHLTQSTPSTPVDPDSALCLVDTTSEKSSLRGRCGTDGISDKLGLATQLHHECPRKPSTTAQRHTPDFQRFLLWSENGCSKNLSEVFPGKEDRGSSDTLAVAPDFSILRGFCWACFRVGKWNPRLTFRFPKKAESSLPSACMVSGDWASRLWVCVGTRLVSCRHICGRATFARRTFMRRMAPSWVGSPETVVIDERVSDMVGKP